MPRSLPLVHPALALHLREKFDLGAGEILARAFLALRARGLPAERALAYAVAAATSSVTEFGVAGPAVTRELQRVGVELRATGRRLAAITVGRRGS